MNQIKKIFKNKPIKKYDTISETSKHTSELRLDSDIRHRRQFYCPTVLTIDEVYRYFYAQYCEIRFKFINQIIEEINPDIIVEFASGLSSRGLVFAQNNKNSIFVDTDLQAINKFKKELIKKNKIKYPSNLILRKFDLLTDDISVFSKFFNCNNKKIVFITEGLLPYLDFSEVKKVYSKFSKLVNKNNQFFWISDLNIQYGKLSKGEESALEMIKNNKNKIEEKINWKILNHSFSSTGHFKKTIINSSVRKKSQVKFYKLKDYKNNIFSREKLRNIIKDKKIKSACNTLLEKKVTMFKLHF